MVSSSAYWTLPSCRRHASSALEALARLRRLHERRAPDRPRRPARTSGAVVADLLEAPAASPSQSIVPSAGHQVIVALAAVVVHVRGEEVARARSRWRRPTSPIRWAWPTSRQMPRPGQSSISSRAVAPAPTASTARSESPRAPGARRARRPPAASVLEAAGAAPRGCCRPARRLRRRDAAGARTRNSIRHDRGHARARPASRRRPSLAPSRRRRRPGCTASCHAPFA